MADPAPARRPWRWFHDLTRLNPVPAGVGPCKDCGRTAEVTEWEVWSADMVEFPRIRLCADCGAEPEG